jgi:anti-sigma B factor antagonist
MDWKFDKRYVGDAVVLELVGRITLGEGSVVFRDLVRECSSGSEPIVILDITGVSYIDSSGIGELVSGYTYVRNRGKNLLLCHPRLATRDLLYITKLAALFQMFPNVDRALSSDRSFRLFYCPVADCNTWTPVSDLAQQVCMHCASEIEVAQGRSGNKSEQGEPGRLRVPSYLDQYVSIVPGTPCILQIPRRFDLFANNALQKALNTIGWNSDCSYQAAAIIDLTELQELSEAGAAVLVQIDQPRKDGNAAVFFAQAPSLQILPKISRCAAVYTSQAEAVAALENLVRSRADRLDGKLHAYGFRTGVWSDDSPSP